MFVSTLPGAWFFGPTTSAADSAAAGRPSVLALIGVYGGIIVLARAWLDLLRVSRSHPGMPVRRVAGVIGAWAVPLALAPPLFSRDLYSYAGQGEMVAHGISPYLYGTGVLGVTPFSTLPGPFWANTPSPYGPAFLWLDGLATHLSRHQVLADLVLLRLLAVAGLAMALWAIPVLARAAGRDAAPAVVLALGSPLVLTTLVGGAHNDALMVGLLLAGLAVARRHGTVPGIVLCALAASVKAPALLAVAVPGLELAGPGGPAHQAARPCRGRLRHRAGHAQRRVVDHRHRVGLGPHGGGPDQGHHRHHAGRLGVPAPDRRGSPGRLRRRAIGGPHGGGRRRARGGGAARRLAPVALARARRRAFARPGAPGAGTAGADPVALVPHVGTGRPGPDGRPLDPSVDDRPRHRRGAGRGGRRRQGGRRLRRRSAWRASCWCSSLLVALAAAPLSRQEAWRPAEGTTALRR